MSAERARVLLVDLLYKPEPRSIDWQKVVDNRLPVAVWDYKDFKGLVCLSRYEPGERYPFLAPVPHGIEWSYASLETGEWVFNSTGENPWPDGVLVEVHFQSGRVAPESVIPRTCSWSTAGTSSDIIASRAVGLEPGYTY